MSESTDTQPKRPPDESMDLFGQPVSPTEPDPNHEPPADVPGARSEPQQQEPAGEAEASLEMLGAVKVAGRRGGFRTLREPGIYLRVPEEEYHAHPALSRSVLAEAARMSPMHAHHRWKGEKEESSSDAASLGTALHAKVLQPGVYEETYDVAAEQCEATKEDGDRCTYSAKVRHDGTWFCGTHAPSGEEPDDIEVLKAGTHEAVEAMTSALQEDPDAHPLLFDLPGFSEVTVLWEDDATGLLCKARLDRVVGLPGGVAIVDLKSTRSAHPEDFRRKVSKYGYWLQPPFYTLAIQEATGGDVPVRDFVFACVESSEPYATQCFRPHPKEKGAVQDRCCNLMDEIAECEDSGVWPSYQDGVAQLGIKRYEKERLGINAS